MKKFILAATILMALFGVLAGCSQQTAAASRVFDKATPEIRELWDKAIAADKANDYVVACSAYRRLLAQKSKMTAEQIETLNAASVAINQRLNTAANSGDAAAKEAAVKLFKVQNY